jgi:hypothetical protein
LNPGPHGPEVADIPSNDADSCKFQVEISGTGAGFVQTWTHPQPDYYMNYYMERSGGQARDSGIPRSEPVTRGCPWWTVFELLDAPLSLNRARSSLRFWLAVRSKHPVEQPDGDSETDECESRVGLTGRYGVRFGEPDERIEVDHVQDQASDEDV